MISAAKSGDTKQLSALIDKGAYANIQDRFGNTPLLYAVRNGHQTTADFLIQLEALLEKRVSIDTRYNNELTALMWASGYNHAQAVKVLLTAGAKPNLTDNRGRTALMIAADEGHEANVQELFEM